MKWNCRRSVFGIYCWWADDIVWQHPMEVEASEHLMTCNCSSTGVRASALRGWSGSLFLRLRLWVGGCTVRWYGALNAITGVPLCHDNLLHRVRKTTHSGCFSVGHRRQFSWPGYIEAKKLNLLCLLRCSATLDLLASLNNQKQGDTSWRLIKSPDVDNFWGSPFERASSSTKQFIWPIWITFARKREIQIAINESNKSCSDRAKRSKQMHE